MRLPRFEYLRPHSLEEACSMLDEHTGQAKVMAGGTDVLVELKKRGGGKPRYVVGLRGIPGLDTVHFDPQVGLRVGSMATFAKLASADVVRKRFPLLWEAARIFSRPQIRHAGTLVGNLCNASPAADAVPPLLALQAKVRVVSARGERLVEAESFCEGPFQTVLAPTEIVAELIVPAPSERSGWSYQRATKRTAEDEALAVAAVCLEFSDGNCTVGKGRIALASVASKPMRARGAEVLIQGKQLDEDLAREAADLAAREINPRSRADYRRLMTAYLVKKSLLEAGSRN